MQGVVWFVSFFLLCFWAKDLTFKHSRINDLTTETEAFKHAASGRQLIFGRA